MKRRKPPVLLVSILLLLVGVMFIGAFRPWEQHGPPPAPGPEGGVLAEGQEGAKPEDLAAKAAEATARATKPQAHAGGTAPVGDDQSIRVKSRAPYYQKPKPPDGGGTPSQWYKG